MVLIKMAEDFSLNDVVDSFRAVILINRVVGAAARANLNPEVFTERNWWAMNEFERDELGHSSDSGGDEPPCCSVATARLRRLRELDNDLGDGLYKLLDDAETISTEKSAEGYYLKTCAHLQKLSATRTASLNEINDLVAHHNRAHMYCRTESIRRENELLRSRVTQHHDTITVLRRQLEDARSDALSSNESRIRCLTAQYESRCANQKKELETKLDSAMDVIRGDAITITDLRKQLQESRKKQKSSKNVISFLNRRVREIVKSIRKGGASSGSDPKCHILGTYDDVLGAPA